MLKGINNRINNSVILFPVVIRRWKRLNEVVLINSLDFEKKNDSILTV